MNEMTDEQKNVIRQTYYAQLPVVAAILTIRPTFDGDFDHAVDDAAGVIESAIEAMTGEAIDDDDSE